MSVRDPRRRRVPRYWTASADAGPEPNPTTMPLCTNLSTCTERKSVGEHTRPRAAKAACSLLTRMNGYRTVSLAASKRSTTSASAAEAEQATPRRPVRRTEDGRQRLRHGIGHGRSCAGAEEDTLALTMASIDG
jgi:hypothetical protein